MAFVKFFSNQHLTMNSCHIQRFWIKVDKRGYDECWTWIGSKDKAGYGRFSIRGFLVMAHRVSWKLFHGDIPEGLKVLHKCNNKACVNPKHLYLNNDSNNMKGEPR